ncbi:MAG: hypothetical protein ACE5R6_14165 [Candidatus Heimdallarchaeota archaeon]
MLPDDPQEGLIHVDNVFQVLWKLFSEFRPRQGLLGPRGALLEEFAQALS